MAEYYKGTVLASPIVRGSSGDTYGTHHSVLGVGGFMEVKTTVDRNAIPVDSINNRIEFDGISSGQRRLGMLVHVLSTNEIYHLHPKYNDVYITLEQWNSLYPTNSSKVAALGNNSNWYPLFSTTTIQNQGENISKKYIQALHTFVVGDVIGYSKSFGGAFMKVSNANANTIEPLGIVSESDYDIIYPFDYGSGFTLTYAGNISTIEILDVSNKPISGGTLYYLSSTLGKLTPVKPTGINIVNKPMLVGTKNNTGIVLQYRGITDTASGVTRNTFNTYTGNTKIYLDKTITGATNIGFFSGKTGIQTMYMVTPQTQFQGTYSSMYNYYYRDTGGYIRLGAPIGQSKRRGYLSNFTPKKSWIYNYKTSGGDKTGWIFVNGDISQNIGLTLTSYQYPGIVFNDVEFSSVGGDYNDGFYTNGYISFDVNGSLNTGTTYNIGGPVYNNKVDKTLRFRTIVSSDSSKIKIVYDDAFIYLSGGTYTGSSVSSGIYTGITTVSNMGIGVGVSTGVTSHDLRLRSFIGSGSTQVKLKNDTIVIYTTGDSNNDKYNLSSPAVCSVGGITPGTILTGKTAFQLFEEMLVPVQYPTLSIPYVTTTFSPSTSLYEVGCCIPTLSVISTFNAGCINPQYTAICDKRSNGVNAYCFTGAQVAGFYPNTSTPYMLNAINYSVVVGSQSWSSFAQYCAGVQPYNSKGGIYNTPLPSGCTATVTATLTGIYPYYYGKLTCGTRPSVTSALVVGGNKVLSCSTGTISVTFSSSASEWTWVAIPSISTSKTCWYVNALDNGKINSAPSDKYPDECIIAVTSAQGCWSNINYKIYMSGTVGAISAPIEFRNS